MEPEEASSCPGAVIEFMAVMSSPWASGVEAGMTNMDALAHAPPTTTTASPGRERCRAVHARTATDGTSMAKPIHHQNSPRIGIEALSDATPGRPSRAAMLTPIIAAQDAQ